MGEWTMITAAVIAISFLPFFEARNQAANYIANPPQDIKTEASFERPSLEVREKCPACEGTGEIVLEETDFGQINATRLGKARRIREKCSFCEGRRTITAFMRPNELAISIARDFEKYKATHQAKGEIQVGNAFIPADVYGSLDRKRLKLIEKAYADGCRTCHWAGIEECRKCDGKGSIECPNKDCRGGWAVTKNTVSFSKSRSGGSSGRYSSGTSNSRRYSRKETKVNVQLCHDCEGARIVKCPKCSGRRADVCRKCNGMGMKQKSY